MASRSALTETHTAATANVNMVASAANLEQAVASPLHAGDSTITCDVDCRKAAAAGTGKTGSNMVTAAANVEQPPASPALQAGDSTRTKPAAAAAAGPGKPKAAVVKDEVHSIVIPPIPCSFPWRNHPHYKQLTELSDAWVLSHFTDMPGADGRPSSFAAEHLIKSAFHMQATLPFADGMSDRMPPIIKMMDWYFMIDNVLDDPSEMGADPAAADEVVDSVLAVFRDTYVHHVPRRDATSTPQQQLVRILTETAAEWWAEMCVGTPRNQKARLSNAFCDYLEANRRQVSYRNSFQLPDVQTYFKLRAHSIGWWPCAVLIEQCQGFELDAEALLHPLLIKLQETTLQHIILVNDITSFKKEYLQGDFFNIVSILYFKKLYDSKRDPYHPRPTLQGATLEALQLIKDKDGKCVQLMAEIRKDQQLMKKEGMAKYLDGLGLWMSGTVYWHLVSARYGICATTNLHTTPPDMQMHHHVIIETSEEESCIVPSSATLSFH